MDMEIASLEIIDGFSFPVFSSTGGSVRARVRGGAIRTGDIVAGLPPRDAAHATVVRAGPPGLASHSPDAAVRAAARVTQANPHGPGRQRDLAQPVAGIAARLSRTFGHTSQQRLETVTKQIVACHRRLSMQRAEPVLERTLTTSSPNHQVDGMLNRPKSVDPVGHLQSH
jgi:hypothetical protein